MNRRRSLWISLVAGVLAVMLVYGVYVLQVRQVELQSTVQVVVPKQFIRAGKVIGAEDVELRPVLKGSYDSAMMTSLREVIGQEAIVPLGTKEPILMWKINRFQLLPGENQATFQIPKEYILSVSGGIRAGDRVRVYVSGEEGTSRKLFEKELIVASVRTSGGTEVDNPKSPNIVSRTNGDTAGMYMSRLSDSGAIDQINLNLSEQEWLAIDELCRMKKHKLVIAFSSFSIENPNGKEGNS